ncbi:MAG: hypothetical protein A2Y77_05265 [Planctomycetes bacterium RBG_13_62_9]|nr:MAG: hypothetical protein A2Y77_05265 [Planctomycetes bacterium RBG_13_62_9]
MNGKTAVAGILIGAIALCATLSHGRAQPQTTGPGSKIGVVSVRNALSGSKWQTQYAASMTKLQSQARTQVEEVSAEIRKEEGELKTLKQGTVDYVEQLQVLREKRNKLDSLQEYYKQRMVLEDRRLMEEVYQEVLRIVKDVAKEKGLDLVLERTEPRFPATSEDLALTLSAHKVLYDGGCVDLTNDVIARLNATGASKPESQP